MNYFIELLLTVPTVIIAIIFHEVAHGFIAYKLGDYTAKAQGRLSLNPLHHIDILGALAFLLYGPAQQHHQMFLAYIYDKVLCKP